MSVSVSGDIQVLRETFLSGKTKGIINFYFSFFIYCFISSSRSYSFIVRYSMENQTTQTIANFNQTELGGGTFFFVNHTFFINNNVTS